MPNRYQIDSQFHIQFHIQRLNLLQDYLLLSGNFTPIPQICTHRATNLSRNIFEEISEFSRKTCIVRKIWKKKWFCCHFEVLAPDFVTINQNFNPIPQIYTSNNTNLTEKNFWKVSQFSRKTYIVCKIWTKMVLLGFWSLTPWVCDNQSKFQSYSTNLHANATILIKKISIKFLNFPRKLALCAAFGEKLFYWDFEELPPDYLTINQNSLFLFYKSTHQTVPFWWQKFLKNFPFSQENWHCVRNWYKNRLIVPRLISFSIPHSMFC